MDWSEKVKGLLLAFWMETRNPPVLNEQEAARRFSLGLVVGVPLLSTVAEKRFRTGMKLLEQVRERSQQTALVLLGDQPDLENHPHVFGWLPDEVAAVALLGMVRLAMQQAQLDALARMLEEQNGRQLSVG